MNLQEHKKNNPFSSIPLIERTTELGKFVTDIEILIDGVKKKFLLDTGADTTVVDALFVNKHPDLFKFVRSEDGTDGLAHKIESKIYECVSVGIGNLKLKTVEMAAFDFGSQLRKSMEGLSVTLGNNVISNAVWSLDIKNKQGGVFF